jgi:galactokinase
MIPLPAEEFERLYGAAPTHVVRAPGRVNLIGEHIDYHGLPVLPLALDREVRLQFRARVDAVVRASTLARGLPAATFELGHRIPPADAGDWSNYVRGAAQSLTNIQGAERGIDLLVHSTLPMAAGLSSSSALAVGAGLALAQVNGVHVEPLGFAEQMAEAERYAGTRGGGMDQAVCLLARSGHALYMDFHPLSVRPIPIAADLRVIVADSLVRAEKSGAAKSSYNERRETGESACASMVSVLGLPQGSGYRDLIDLDRNVLELACDILSGAALRYFRHVISEARRVRRAAAALQAADLVTLGKLVDASHESLRDDYMVSTPELDQLVRIAKDAGALGARLTGAGFGGSMIVLVTPERLRHVRDALEHDFYRPRGISHPIGADRLLPIRSAGGACVEVLPQAIG